MSRAALRFEQVRMPLLDSDHRLSLDMEAAAGEFVVFVGPSRAGKSLAIELAAGLVVPEQGRVTVLGQAWEEGPYDDPSPLRRQVGVVLQQPGLLSNLTLLNNVLLPLRYHRPSTTPRADEQRAMTHLEQLGVAALRDRFPAELNPGEARRGAIARAMVLEPELLLLDDPVAGLDAESLRTLTRYLAAHRAAHPLTVVAALRGAGPLVEQADRVLVLFDGRIEADGPREQVLGTITGALRGYLA